MLTIAERRIADLTILDLEGCLSGDEADQLLPRVVDAHIGEGRYRFLLNLAELEWMNSGGLQLLLWAYKAVADLVANYFEHKR